MNNILYSFILTLIEMSTVSVINTEEGTVYMIQNDIDPDLGDLRMDITYSNPMYVRYALYTDTDLLCIASKPLYEQSKKNSDVYFMEKVAEAFSKKIIKQELIARRNNMLKFFKTNQRS